MKFPICIKASFIGYSMIHQFCHSKSDLLKFRTNWYYCWIRIERQNYMHNVNPILITPYHAYGCLKDHDDTLNTVKNRYCWLIAELGQRRWTCLYRCIGITWLYWYHVVVCILSGALSRKSGYRYIITILITVQWVIMWMLLSLVGRFFVKQGGILQSGQSLVLRDQHGLPCVPT